MRNALIDHARRRKARGRDAVIYFAPDENFFSNLPAEADEKPERIVLLEEALARVEAEDKRLAEVVKQFYYAGYSVAEMAQAIHKIQELNPAACRRGAERRFSASRMANRYFDLYKSLITTGSTQVRTEALCLAN